MITHYILAAVLSGAAPSGEIVMTDTAGPSDAMVTAMAISEGVNVLHVLAGGSTEGIAPTHDEALEALTGLRDAMKEMRGEAMAPSMLRIDDAAIAELERIIAAHGRGEDVRESARLYLAAVMPRPPA